MMKVIDLFNHYLPPAFYEKIVELGGDAHMLKRASQLPAMADIAYRLKLMERFEGYSQVPCIVSPNVEALVAPEHTATLARFANEEFARLCEKYPEQFPSFVAVLPLDDLEKAEREAEYAVKQLNAAGVQIFTNQNGRAVDSPEFFKLYKKLEDMDAALWIHPARTAAEPYYPAEEAVKYELWWMLLWPVETSMAMARLVFSGLFETCPDLKVIVHHAGGMIPMMEGRLETGLQLYGTRTAPQYSHLTDSPIKHKNHKVDEFRKFYADCAVCGSQATIECAINFFGTGNMVFASDMPFDPEDGSGYISRSIRDIENLRISQKEKEDIFYGNAQRILRLNK